MTSTATKVKQTYVSGSNLAIVDNDNFIWLMGHNNGGVTGLLNHEGKQTHLTKPMKTEIKLQENENIINFDATCNVHIVHTNQKRLYISYPQRYKSNNPNSDRDYSDDDYSDEEEENFNSESDEESEDNGSSNDDDDSDPDSEESEVERAVTVELTPPEAEMIESLKKKSKCEYCGKKNCTNEVCEEIRTLSNPKEVEPKEKLEKKEILPTICLNQPNSGGKTLSEFNKIKSKVKLSKKNYILVSDAADDFICHDESVLFRIGNTLNIYSMKTPNSKNICSHEKTTDNESVYIKINMFDKSPLIYVETKCAIPDKFYYSKSGNTHCIYNLSNNYTEMAFYKSDLVIDPTEIFENSKRDGQYAYNMYHEGHLYGLSHVTESIHKIIEEPINYIRCVNHDIAIITYNESILCYKDHKMTKIKEYESKYDKHIINGFIKKGKNILFINKPTKKPNAKDFMKTESCLIFNVANKQYQINFAADAFYYFKDETVYCTISEPVNKTKMNTTVWSKFKSITLDNGNHFGVYKLTTDLKIASVKFTDKIMCLTTKSGNHYIRGATNSQGFTEELKEIVLDDDDSALVSKRLIIYEAQKYNDDTRFIVKDIDNQFDKLVDMMDMKQPNASISIQIKKTITEDSKMRVLAQGEGVLRNFCESALGIFRNKYLIFHDTFCQLNMEQFQKLKTQYGVTYDNYVFHMGMGLRLIISAKKQGLGFHMPLDILKHIREMKEFTRDELEHFIKMKDEEMYKTIILCREDKSLLEEYKTYEELLISKCEFNPDEQYQHVCKLIAEGFINKKPFKNLNNMNYPTLDYYMCGDLKIDREALKKNMRIDIPMKISKSSIKKEEIISKICALPEDKLKVLLQNWSGFQTLISGYTYYLYFQNEKRPKQDMHFSTCSTTIHANEKYIKNNDGFNLFLDLITTTCTMLKDF